MSENKKEKEIELKDDAVELLEDEVITLFDDDGKPVDFHEVAVIDHEDEFYALLQPVELIDGIGEDEAVIFKIKHEDDETDSFEPVKEEAILEAVFNKYLEAMAQMELEEGDSSESEEAGGCGGGCGGCGGGCSIKSQDDDKSQE